MFSTLFAKDFELEEVKKQNGRLFDFVDRNSKRLLVTIGDSWTFGWRLNEQGNRVNLCFGNIISEHLGADFLNLSVPAINNTWMTDKFLTLSDQCTLYDRIDVIIILTEIGRELNTDFDFDPIFHQQYRASRDCRTLAQSLANYNAERLASGVKSNVNLILACNYVTDIYPRLEKLKFVDRTWLEVLYDHSINDECLVVGSWVFPKYQEVLELYDIGSRHENLTELTDWVDKGNARLELIYNSGYTHKIGYGHPNKDGHAKWADYLISKVFKYD